MRNPTAANFCGSKTNGSAGACFLAQALFGGDGDTLIFLLNFLHEIINLLAIKRKGKMLAALIIEAVSMCFLVTKNRKFSWLLHPPHTS